MKNLIVLAVAIFFATNAGAADWKWAGSGGWRWDSQNLNDGMNNSVTVGTGTQDTSTKKVREHEMRGNLGVTGGWEHVEWGFDMRTQGNNANSTNASLANSDWTQVGGAGATSSDATLKADIMFFRYLHDFGSMDFNITVGRNKTALITDTTWETLYSNATRFQGFSEGLKFGMFGLNMTQYLEGAITTAGAQGVSGYATTAYAQAQTGASKAKFAMTYQFQPYMTWKFTDEIETMFSVTYSIAMDQAHTNVAGGYDPSVWDAAGTTPAHAAAGFKMYNRRQWDFLDTLQLPFNLAFTGELILGSHAQYDANSLTSYSTSWTSVGNPRSIAVSSSAWNLGLAYGKLRKAMDFTIGYAYGSKGIGSMYSDYTNPWFAADQKGHHIMAAFNIADNLNIGFNAYFLKEKQGLDATTGLAYAGTVANQNLSDKMWEINTGVTF